MVGIGEPAQLAVLVVGGQALVAAALDVDRRQVRAQLPVAHDPFG